MHTSTISSSTRQFVSKAVTAVQDMDLGTQIHASAVKLGYHYHSTVASTLSHMYANCGTYVHQIFKVFDRIPQRNQVSWNSMINALCKYEELGLALEAFHLMGLERIQPSLFTLVNVALACSNLNMHDRIRFGKEVHGYSLRVDDRKTFTNNSLMAIYAKLGRIDDAKIVFKCFAHGDMVSWNTVISSFSRIDRFHEALE